MTWPRAQQSSAACGTTAWASLNSFIAHGHRLRLFRYEDVRVPDGVSLEDAAQIIEKVTVFQ
jgi:hypothetical protein